MLNIAPEIEAVLKEAARDKTAAPMLSWLDMSRWDDSEPEPIEWSITNLVPREQVGLFSGVGGTGKTTTELLKDVAHVVGLALAQLDANARSSDFRWLRGYR